MLVLVPQRNYADELSRNHAFGTEVRSNVMKAVEELITKPTFVATNKPAGGRLEPTITRVHYNSCDPTTCVAKTGALFNGGAANEISIVFCGENHLYQQQTRPVKNPKLFGKALGEAQRAWDRSDQDRQRADQLLLSMGGVAYPAPDLVIFERAMRYTAPAIPAIAREDNLTASTSNPKAGEGLTSPQRSLVVAGYMFLCVAGGDQNHHDRIFVFYGERHVDILDHFEYFARHSGANWVQNRPRSYLIIPSHVQG